MVSATSIRNKLEAKVFSKLGSTVVVYSLSGSSIDKWGDSTDSYDAGTSIKGVPYNLISEETFYVSFGDLEDGAMDMVVPYDTVIDLNSKVNYDSNDYQVKQIEDFVITDLSVGKAIRLIPL